MPDAVDPSSELSRLAELLAQGSDEDDFAELAGPLYWPTLSADAAGAEWDALRVWVERFRTRYPWAIKIPDCWYIHTDAVEALSALRDFERASFSATAPPTAAVEWQRAFRDIEARYENWIKKWPCQQAQDLTRGHAEHKPKPAPEGWNDWLESDRAGREARQLAFGLE
jgi:hypothetical protein